MEFDAEGKSGSGRVPDFGAIFISNCSTKKECLRKKVFGLPSNQASFVKHVSDGTFLFLFEYEKRELYGVFQASCDGAMNIVPDAFKSVGKHFPAQICFRTIWICDPLPEYDFRDAIKDNYYSKYKFNFGLSEDQCILPSNDSGPPVVHPLPTTEPISSSPTIEPIVPVQHSPASDGDGLSPVSSSTTSPEADQLNTLSPVVNPSAQLHPASLP
ncbi:hypothetical protein NE237_001350 [Protea cynaroides]|uniref:DCD domain-containing protein n=1 Tax=Protea cynaroides TaxID=273540 RepID=A0A9Q0QYB9_9MAGN|nr:hypothetical protein NE237_001350 [Protea cynaroides]